MAITYHKPTTGYFIKNLKWKEFDLEKYNFFIIIDIIFQIDVHCLYKYGLSTGHDKGRSLTSLFIKEKKHQICRGNIATTLLVLEVQKLFLVGMMQV